MIGDTDQMIQTGSTHGDPGLFGDLQLVYIQDQMAVLISAFIILIRQEPEFL